MPLDYLIIHVRPSNSDAYSHPTFNEKRVQFFLPFVINNFSHKNTIKPSFCDWQFLALNIQSKSVIFSPNYNAIISLLHLRIRRHKVLKPWRAQLFKTYFFPFLSQLFKTFIFPLFFHSYWFKIYLFLHFPFILVHSSILYLVHFFQQ